MIDKKETGNRIKQIRFSKGDTLEDFGIRIARVLNIPSSKAPSKSNVSKWEAGSSLPNKIRLKAIADIGEIPVEELLYGNIEKNSSIDDKLFNTLEKFIARKNGILQEIKLLAPSALSGLTFGLAFKEMSKNAVKDNEALQDRIKELKRFGSNYIKDKFNNYTYEKFIKDFPKSNLQNFELNKEKENALFEELLENYWNILDKNFSNYSLINSKFTNQISDELNKINRIAVTEDKQEYYTNEVIKPFLDQAAKDFKEYIKDYIDTEE